MPRRRLLASLAGVAAFVALGTHVAQAAAGPSFGADFAVVSACTSDGVRADLDIDATVVRSVTVRDLPAECLGNTVTVTLGHAAGGVSVTERVTGTSTRLALGSPLPVRDVTSIALLLTD